MLSPSAKEVQAEIAIYRSDYATITEKRIEDALFMQTVLLVAETFWRVLANMLIGMVLFRRGILSGEKDKQWYLNAFWCCLLIGLSISSIGLYWSNQVHWEMRTIMGCINSLNYVASLFVAFSFIAISIYWSKGEWFAFAQRRFQEVGRMAFTNYILSSILGTLFFYGYGLGYFATLERPGIALVVLAIWLLLFIVSYLVLRKWKQGPLERLWRSLTYR